MRLLGRRSFVTTAAMLFMTVLPGSAQAQQPVKRQAQSADVWVRTELYFGTNRADGEVSDVDFNSFVESKVTPLFPDGLSLLTGTGQFKNSNGVIIREKLHLLILLYPPQMQDANRKIQGLRELYKTMFGQESVLRVDSFSLVSF